MAQGTQAEGVDPRWKCIRGSSKPGHPLGRETDRKKGESIPDSEVLNSIGRAGRSARLAGRLLVFLIACSAVPRTVLGLPQQESDPCIESDATRVAEQLGCFTLEQFQTILNYRNLEGDELEMREALASAAEMAACINNFHAFPRHPQQRKDYQCLQKLLLDFYQRIEEARKKAGELHFQDVLARASLNIHYCMIDESLPTTRCLSLMESAFKDYRIVFEAAARVAGDPNGPEARELTDTFGMSPEAPAPEMGALKRFVALALENSRRFPVLLGRPVGEALKPVLCAAYTLYPAERRYVAQHYNLLIRFDIGNLAAASRLFEFMNALSQWFQPVQEIPSFLELHPADWSTSPPPCGEDDWMFVFPDMSVRPGYRFPDRNSLEETLGRLDSLLTKAADFAEQRIHLWKPFQSYGKLLLRMAQSLTRSGSRDPEVWRTRHLLMEKARDALILRSVDPSRYPLDVKVLRPPISEQIQSYGFELLNELKLSALIEFAEGYFEADQAVLDDQQKALLHWLLAVTYALTGEAEQSLAHLQESNLQPSDLEVVLGRFREVGVGARPVQ